MAEAVASNPLIAKPSAKAKFKADRLDAQMPAQLLRCDYLVRLWEPDEGTSRLSKLISHRTVAGDRTAVRKRIPSWLAARLVWLLFAKLFGPAGRTWLDSLSAEQLDPQGQLILTTDLHLHDALRSQIESLKEELTRQPFAYERIAPQRLATNTAPLGTTAPNRRLIRGRSPQLGRCGCRQQNLRSVIAKLPAISTVVIRNVSLVSGVASLMRVRVRDRRAEEQVASGLDRLDRY